MNNNKTEKTECAICCAKKSYTINLTHLYDVATASGMQSVLACQICLEKIIAVEKEFNCLTTKAIVRLLQIAVD